MCRVARVFHKSSQDDGIWEKYFSSKERLKTLLEEEKERKKHPMTKKEMFMKELNVVHNLTKRKRY